MEFFFTIGTVVAIYIPMFYRQNKSIRELQDRVNYLENELKNYNVVKLEKRK
jgi:hypothetical protein